jgi:hypothetical protein
MTGKNWGTLLTFLAAALAFASPSYSRQDVLASAAQNPIGDLVSLPFEYDGSYGVGNLGNTQSTVLFKPVAPLHLTEDLTLVLRGIVPLVWKPELFSGDISETGMGDITVQTFFTPAQAIPIAGGEFTYGIGPTFQLNTATDPSLGTSQNAVGADAVVFFAIKPWTFGGLLSNVWGVSDVPAGGARVNAMTAQPFLNFNMDDGWYLTSSPVITANWSAASDQKWTIPLGGGFGRIFEIGSQPVNAQVQAFGYADTPTGGPDWSVRASFTFLFPE